MTRREKEIKPYVALQYCQLLVCSFKYLVTQVRSPSTMVICCNRLLLVETMRFIASNACSLFLQSTSQASYSHRPTNPSFGLPLSPTKSSQRTQIQRHTAPSASPIFSLFANKLPRLWEHVLIHPLPPRIVDNNPLASRSRQSSAAVGPYRVVSYGARALPPSVWRQRERAHVEHGAQAGQGARVVPRVGRRRW